MRTADRLRPAGHVDRMGDWGHEGGTAGGGDRRLARAVAVGLPAGPRRGAGRLRGRRARGAGETLEGAPPALQDKVAAEVADAGQRPANRDSLRRGAAALPAEGLPHRLFDGRGRDGAGHRVGRLRRLEEGAQRVSTTAVAKGQADDPWSKIGEMQISKATAQSMNEVAALPRRRLRPGRGLRLAGRGRDRARLHAAGVRRFGSTAFAAHLMLMPASRRIVTPEPGC